MKIKHEHIESVLLALAAEKGQAWVQEAATQEDIKTETVADIVQSLPSFTETQADDLVLPSLHMANRELRRAKNHVQKWERVCAALRELNKHRDIVRQIVDSSSRIVSEK
ncbi:DUF1627 domain-containing protein [Escherichia coli]|nr:DUF1627 domain-containing protein [Escherichia coli]NJU69045.1 DUF1627 domain-containing protein [Escherichia coli]